MNKKHLTCQRPDRHEPKLICGYPLPCPYHTIVIEEKDLWNFLDRGQKARAEIDRILSEEKNKN